MSELRTLYEIGLFCLLDLWGFQTILRSGDW
jgi:hypothetical protein